jgi:hypothetical protein
MPVELIKLGGGRRRWFDDDQVDFGGLCCCSCRWNVAFSFVGSVTFVSFASAGGVCITIKPRMGSKNLVQLVPNTGSSSFKPPPHPAASVQYKFQGEGTSHCSQKLAGRHISSTSVFSSPLILSKVFKGLGSDKEQCVPARSNQFIREVELVSYLCIRIW